MPVDSIVDPQRPGAIVEAARILKRGDLVAFPTETVYGLGADASNPAALEKLYAAKGRPSNHPVIVHLAFPEQLSDWAVDIPPNAWALAKAFWPGPLTLILPRAGHVPDSVTGGQDSVGLRIPSHPVALELLRAFGGGIAAPSANRFGKLSPTCAEHVAADLGDAVDLILDGGPCRVGVESSIVDLTHDELVLLRPGMISLDALSEAAGMRVLWRTHPAPETTRAPGGLSSHYAPQAPLELVASPELENTFQAYQKAGRHVAVLAFQAPRQPLPPSQWLTAPADPERYAQQLYANLRRLDATGCDRILVAAVPDDNLWQAVHDRLRRAAHPASQETGVTHG